MNVVHRGKHLSGRWEPNGMHAVGGVLYVSILSEMLGLRHISLLLQGL